MRASRLLALLIFATVVIAGGYQGCLEKVWLFKAYEIEGLNPGPHSLGWKCKAWDDASNTCRNNEWMECVGRRDAHPRCDFGEFMHHMGKADGSIAWAVPATGNMNAVETAKNCVFRFGRNRGGVPNTPPYKIMKDTIEWNDMVMKVSKIVDDTWKAGRHNVDNEHMWDSFDDVREKIILARTGDHGPYAIARTEAELGDKFEIHRQNLGENPMTYQQWETVDWKETGLKAIDAGIGDGVEQVRNFLHKFYGKETWGTEPRAHMRLIRTYKRSMDKSICRKFVF